MGVTKISTVNECLNMKIGTESNIVDHQLEYELFSSPYFAQKFIFISGSNLKDCIISCAFGSISFLIDFMEITYP